MSVFFNKCAFSKFYFIFIEQVLCIFLHLFLSHSHTLKHVQTHPETETETTFSKFH